MVASVRNLILTLAFAALPCQGAFAVLHHSKVQASAGTSSVVTITSTTAGNFLAVEVESQLNVIVLSVTATGDTFTCPIEIQNTTSTQAVQICYAPNIVSGTTSLTVNFNASGPNYGFIYWQEWTGVATSSPLDTTASATGSSSSAATGNFAATTGDLVIGIAITGATATVGAGYTLLDTDTFSIPEWQTAASSIINATAGPSVSQWAIVAATFKVAGNNTVQPRHH